VGGLIGSIIAQNYGFTALFVSAGIISFVSFLIIILFLPKLIILRKKDQKNSIQYKLRR
jgi:predicted MFS family arabinose efflux permease